MPTATKTKTVKLNMLTMKDIKDFIRTKVNLEKIDRLDIKTLWEKDPSARSMFFRLNFYQEKKNDSPFTSMEMVKSMFVRVDNKNGILVFRNET